MKIAIVSDLHIGYERFRQDALRQAKMALEKAIGIADAILVPGDIFDKRAPKPDVIAEAINLFRDLRDSNTLGSEIAEFRGQGSIYTKFPIIAVPGTHERTAAGKENPLALLSLAGLLADTSESTTIIRKGDERVAVFGLGGVPEEQVKSELLRLKPSPVPGAFNIFMFHQSIYEILPFNDSFIHYDDLPDGFDLYVCGHIHNRIEATVHGKPFLIPGSTVLTQLKDKEQERKGFIVFDTESHTHEFVEIDSRDFVLETVKAEGATASDVASSIRSSIEKAVDAHNNPVVRVVVSGTLEKGSEASDIALQKLVSEFSGRAEIEIDMSRLESEGLGESIDQIRAGKLGNMSIKEIGMALLRDRLSAEGYSSKIDPQTLFSILSESKKEEAIKAVLELLEKEK
ncbi:MAG: DNA repair exonuclease [Candidatus Marsarchaeota archaeon]|jgi:DNA repair exonuclease SbcCD nuclease subunit|nr:DNA repair exonuclease [Candidatus Marsarchaeota archaeon]